jgi:3-oxoacyl-[acyl-carrier protein] reductase
MNILWVTQTFQITGYNMIDLSNKTALVTGGSRGIGKAISIKMAEAGCDVAINYRKNDSQANIVVDEILNLGRKSCLVKADLANRDQVFKMIETTVNQLGKIDILINNAGIWEYNPIDSMTEENLRRTIDINLMGCFYTSSAVVPYMKKQKSGNIIYISSTAGQRGEGHYSPYAATKSGLIGLTKSLAAELADDNIRVNCVAPGWVKTDMSIPSLEDKYGKEHLKKILMKRAAEPDELAGPVLFLASELSSFITGEVLNVNGGAVLCG